MSCSACSLLATVVRGTLPDANAAPPNRNLMVRCTISTLSQDGWAGQDAALEPSPSPAKELLQELQIQPHLPGAGVVDEHWVLLEVEVLGQRGHQAADAER